MIRAVALLSLSTLLLLTLYLPSTRPQEVFVHQLRLEHARTLEFWGEAPTRRIFQRMVRLQDGTAAVAPVPTASSAFAENTARAAPARPGVEPAAAKELAQVTQRLFNNAYFRSIDALLALASYRLAALLEWWPAGWILALALLLDALLERAVKSKEFGHHNPEMFALYASTAIFVLCACALALVSPWPLHPLAWAAAPYLVVLLLTRAVAHFHKRP